MWNYIPLLRAWFDEWQERDYEEWLDWSIGAPQCFLELRQYDLR